MHISKSLSIIAVAVVVLVLCTVAATASPSVQSTNASKAAVATPHTARVGNATTAAVKTPPVVGAGVWHNETVGSGGGEGTSLQLSPAGWPAISYYDSTYVDLYYTYKDASGWHIQTVDSVGDVGW